MTFQEWKAAGKSFNYKGHDIFYREGGSGELLLLVHGFPTASWDWERIWTALTDRYHVIALDMIGFGFSAKPRAYHYSIIDQADLHEVFLEKNNFASAHILAHDYGDTVVQEMVARWQMRKTNQVQGLDIQSIAYLNGGIFPRQHRPRLIQKVLASPIGRYLHPFLGRHSLARTFKDIFGKNTQPTEKELDEFWALVDYNKGKVIIPLLIQYMHERPKNEVRWVTALKQEDVPQCFINGAADPISGAHVANYYKQHIPQANVSLLEDIGHYPQVEDAAGVLAAYFAFREG